jgi:hypothetical protein
MTSQEVLNYVQAKPFRPFRIRMNSGRTFDIRHPEMVRIGKRDVLIFTLVSDSPEIYDRWENLSLLLIESLAPLDAAVARAEKDVPPVRLGINDLKRLVAGLLEDFAEIGGERGHDFHFPRQIPPRWSYRRLASPAARPSVAPRGPQ